MSGFIEIYLLRRLLSDWPCKATGKKRKKMKRFRILEAMDVSKVNVRDSVNTENNRRMRY